MKKAAIILLAFISISTLSCDKEYKFYGFDLEESVELEIPAGNTEFDTQNSVNLYLESILDEKNTSTDLFEEVSIEEVSIDTAYYNMIDSVDIHISASGTAETILARNDSTDTDYNYFTGHRIVKLNVSDEKMDDYIKASVINIRAGGRLFSTPVQNKVIKVNMRFRVLTYVK